MLRPSKAIAKQRLQRVLDKISMLKELPSMSQEFIKWRRDTRVAIENTFDDSTAKVEEFNRIRYTSLVVVMDSNANAGRQRAYISGLESASAVLQSMIDEIEEYWSDDDELGSPVVSPTPERTNTTQVFIIHGHDHGTRDTVARFLQNLGLNPVILQEQPDEGRTIIEKFEEYAQIDFAVALFTPDDQGGRPGDDPQPRARQNVIFEVGYFIGRFGRNRLCALLKGQTEIPSDYSGVIYIQLDESGGWKIGLMRELRNAGFDIDANRALQ